LIANGRTLIIAMTDRDQRIAPTDSIKTEVYCAMKAWVYIATMSDTEGVVKIGYSTKDPTIRLREWSEATGAPGKANLAYAALVEHPRRVEAATHRDLKAFNTKGEWFRVPPVRAMAAIRGNGEPLFEDGSLVETITAAETNKVVKDFHGDRRRAEKKQKIKREFGKAKRNLLSIPFALALLGAMYFFLKYVLKAGGLTH